MRCSYLVHVLVDVVAGDGGVGDKVKELSDRHHRHTVLHKEVWMEAQDVILKFGVGGGTGGSLAGTQKRRIRPVCNASLRETIQNH